MSLPEYNRILWKWNNSVGVTEGNAQQVVKIACCHHVMQSGGILSCINFKTWVQSFMVFVLE